MTARDMANLYEKRGPEIFPPIPDSFLGRVTKKWRFFRDLAYFRYERDGLQIVLEETFGGSLLKDAKVPLCIPSCDGRYGEVYVFKTPHHSDFTKDGTETIVKVALSTSAAPTFFQPLESGGYRYLDGGLWANNPIMVGLTDALSSFDVSREQVKILSICCGESRYLVTENHLRWGGLLSWKKATSAAIHLQSLNATGQASLLIGADHIKRIVPQIRGPEIELDDYMRAMQILPPLATQIVDEEGDAIAAAFITKRA